MGSQNKISIPLEEAQKLIKAFARITTGTKTVFPGTATSTSSTNYFTPYSTLEQFNQLLKSTVEKQRELEQLVNKLEIMEQGTKKLIKLYVTFGQVLHREKHVHILEAHPDGWVELHCNNTLEFTKLKSRFLGVEYSHIYLESEWINYELAASFPLGCRRVITAKDLLEPISLTDHLD